MSHPILSVASYLICVLYVLPIAAGDWTQWRGTQRDGVAHDSPPLVQALPENGLQPLWLSEEMRSGGRGGWSSPVVAEGRVYVFVHTKEKLTGDDLPPKKYPYLPPEERVGMTPAEYDEYERNRRDEDEQRGKAFQHTEFLYCLDADSGDTLWTNEQESVYTRFPHSGTPLVADGRVYLLGAGRMARAVDANSGASLWSTRLPGEFRDEHLHSSFAKAGNVVCVLADGLFGLEASSGRLLWDGNESDMSGRSCSPVVWRDGEQDWFIVNVGGGETVCVDPQTGRQRWRIESEGVNATPIIAGDKLITYGRSRKQGLRCWDLTKNPPELNWKFQRAADSGSTPVVVGDYVYVQGERRLACVDLETGDAEWSGTLDIGNPRYTSLIAADDKVFYAFDGLLCFAATPEGYQILYDAKVNREGLLAGKETLREMLNIPELERTAEGQKEAERLWQREIENQGVLPCATPAIADGKLYLRLKNHLACYDLNVQ